MAEHLLTGRDVADAHLRRVAAWAVHLVRKRTVTNTHEVASLIKQANAHMEAGMARIVEYVSAIHARLPRAGPARVVRLR